MFVRRRRYSQGRLVRRQAQALLLKIIGAVLISAAVTSVLAFIFSRESIRIDTVFIEGHETIAEDELRSLVTNKLHGAYFFLFPRENVLLFPRGEINAEVLSAFPKVAEADARITDFQSITLTVREREPFALWCGEETKSGVRRPALSVAEDACYFLDNTGFVYTKAADFSGDAFFRYFGPLLPPQESRTESPLGSRFLSDGEWNSVLRFLYALEDVGLSVVSLALADNDYVLFLSEGPRLLVSRAQDLAEVARTTEAAFRSEEIARSAAELDYIDFRFGNRVYYK